MLVIRTSLSLIGFGFTIYQVFAKLLEAQVLRSSAAPRRFGEALVFLGIAMLVLGIGYHVAFMIELRKRREQLKRDGLVHAESGFPESLTLIVAIALLVIGVFAGVEHDIQRGTVRLTAMELQPIAFVVDDMRRARHNRDRRDRSVARDGARRGSVAV
jgi:putative membrane protein